MKSKYDRVHIPRGYVVQRLAERCRVYSENFVDAIAYFSDGQTLRETREVWEFSESDKIFHREARYVRIGYIRDSRRQPSHALHQTRAI